MFRLVIVLLVTAALGLAASERLRRATAELARDASDQLITLLLRATSGFSSEVAEEIQDEERARRLRWRSEEPTAPRNRTSGRQTNAVRPDGRPADRAEIQPSQADPGPFPQPAAEP